MADVCWSEQCRSCAYGRSLLWNQSVWSWSVVPFRWYCARGHGSGNRITQSGGMDWQPLELRRAHSRNGLQYQLTNGVVATPHIPYLLPHSHAPRSSRHAHTLQHATYQCRTNYFKYSYFPHTVVLWNALPQAVVSSPTLEAFKTSPSAMRLLISGTVPESQTQQHQSIWASTLTELCAIKRTSIRQG